MLNIGNNNFHNFETSFIFKYMNQIHRRNRLLKSYSDKIIHTIQNYFIWRNNSNLIYIKKAVRIVARDKKLFFLG